MSDPNCNDQGVHENVWLLLPWYVNDTLETAERQVVDEHLVGCAPCREELGRCRGLSAALRSGEESAPSPHPIQLARLLERVEASERGLDRDEDADRDEAGDRTAAAGRAVWTSSERAARLLRSARTERPERAARTERPEWAGRAALLAATPRPVRIALAGQLAALLLLAAAFAFSQARMAPPAGAPQALRTPAAGAPAATYHTLSAPAGGDGAAAPRPQIRVVFAEGATEKQIREVLLRARGRLVDGPSPLGTYILEIPAPAAGAPPDSLAIVLAYLRAQAIVRFAEPVAGSAAAQRPAAGAETAEPGAASGRGDSPAPP